MKTIFLVEDEELLADTIRDELTEAGYNILVFATGRECIEEVKITTPDLFILDVKLPDMSGLKLLEIIRKWYHHLNIQIPVIMCTAYDSFKTDYEIWASNVSDYIVKPIDLKELGMKIKKILG